MRDRQPTFSLIIPTYQRPEQLSLCLQTLTRLDYSREHFEVVVVDDGSRTPVDQVVTPFTAASQLLVSFLFAYHNADPDQARFATTSNLALPADAFRALGGFDPAFPVPGGEDYELCKRWVSHGYRLRYAPEAVVYHTHALTLRTFLRQHFHYGCGAFHLRRTGAPQGGRRRRRQPFGFYWRLFQYVSAQGYGRRTAGLLALLLMAQMTNAVGAYWERRRQSRRR
jgi:GT2 family glycosyltransferase